MSTTVSDEQLMFANTVASCITGPVSTTVSRFEKHDKKDEEFPRNFEYCSCQHIDHSMFSESTEENGSTTILCNKCEKRINLGEPGSSDENETNLEPGSSNQEILRTSSQSSICQCGNTDPQKFQDIEDDDHFSLYCLGCEKIINLGEHSQNPANPEEVVNEYDFCAGQEEDNPLCKKCGNQNLEDFDQIDEKDHFLLICKICENIIPFTENEENILDELTLFCDNLQLRDDHFSATDRSMSDRSSNQLLVFQAEANVITCSICEKIWNFDGGCIPLEADMHSHHEYSEINADKSVSVLRKMCTKQPNWEKVKSTEFLKTGDHVCFWNGYWRHAIVTLSSKEKVHLIGYRFKPKCQIFEEAFHPAKFKFKRAVYDGETFPPDIVITRARSRLGEERYHIITNYARAFPRWCKTGYGGICSKTPSDLGAFHISQSDPVGQEQVLEVSGLNIGDHIKWWRKGFHWHHAVVLNTLKRGADEFVDVIHYTLMDLPSGMAGKLAKILEKWKWVEVSVERLKWYAADKKLVSFTGTVGTQFPAYQKQANSTNYEIIECNFNATCVGSKKSNVATQVTFASGNSTEDATDLDNDDDSWTKVDVDEFNCSENIENIEEDEGQSSNSKPPSDPGLLYKVNYSGTRHQVDVILEKAKSRVGEANYLLLKKNCEHFASWCCTGKSSSKQVDALMQYITKFTGAWFKESLVVLEALIRRVPEAAPRIFGSAKVVLSKLVKVVPIEAIGFIVFAVIEVIIKSIAIYRIWKAWKDKKITKEERNATIAKEIAEGTGSVLVGGLLGICLGALIPIPILGSTLGLIIGAVVGHVAGRKIGYKIAESQKQKAIEAGNKQKQE